MATAKVKTVDPGTIEKTSAGNWKLPSDAVILTGDRVFAKGGRLEGSIAALNNRLMKDGVKGMDSQPMPRSVVWKIDRGEYTIVVLELDPQILRLKWVKNDSESAMQYGSGVEYVNRRVALPYVVITVPFKNNVVIDGGSELFYRPAALQGLDDELFLSNLLNVSPFRVSWRHSWICTQYLHSEEHDGTMNGQLHALMLHLWGGGFNRSSEAHEGASAFSVTCKESDDPRITDISRWEEATAEDPEFVLNDVKWPSIKHFQGDSTGKLTIGKQIDWMFQHITGISASDNHTASGITRLVSACKGT